MILPFTSGRPIVKIIIFGKHGQREVDALLDSGADHSLFDIELAKNLGLNFSNAKHEPFGGIGKGSIKVSTIPVQIQISGISKKVSIPIGFLKNPTFPPLLGTMGFFDNFVIKFDKAKNIIEIT